MGLEGDGKENGDFFVCKDFFFWHFGTIAPYFVSGGFGWDVFNLH